MAFICDCYRPWTKLIAAPVLPPTRETTLVVASVTPLSALPAELVTLDKPCCAWLVACDAPSLALFAVEEAALAALSVVEEAARLWRTNLDWRSTSRGRKAVDMVRRDVRCRSCGQWQLVKAGKMWMGGTELLAGVAEEHGLCAASDCPTTK